MAPFDSSNTGTRFRWIAVSLGAVTALYISAGQYKATFPNLPDLTLVFLSASVALTAVQLVAARKLAPAFSAGIAIWWAVTTLAVFTTLVTPKWPGWSDKLIRLVVLDGWAFLSCIILAEHRSGLSTFFIVIFGVAGCISVATLDQSSAMVGTRLLNSDITNYLGLSRLGAMGSIIALFQLRAARRVLSRGLWAAATLLLGFTTLASGGRGPSIGLAAAAAATIAIDTVASRKWRPRSTIVLFPAIAAVGVALGVRSGSFSVLLARLQLGFAGTSALERMNRLLAGITLWSTSPIIGRGPNAFPTYYGTFVVADDPHNVVVELAAEFGLIPTIIVVASSLIVLTRLIMGLWARAGTDQSLDHTVLALMIFWFFQAPLMSISSAKYACAMLGAGLGLCLGKSRRRSRPGCSP